MKTLVLGVGNTLLADEGAGVHAMHYLKDHYEFADTEFLDGGTLSFSLAGDIAETNNLIIFDAAELDAEPGFIRVFEGAELDKFLLSGCRSVHEVGFADLMDITRLQESLPENYALIGIQPEILGWGDKPGEAVDAALPKAASQAASLIYKWAGETCDKAVNQ
jgi:hydrogenase maturation protease